MGSIQLAMCDQAKADTLRAMLARSTPLPVKCVDAPDFLDACVVVMDGARFQQMGAPRAHAGRVVLITSNEPGNLREAWDAGVNSVLSEQDPLNTVVLAVLATCLRSSSGRQKDEGDADH